MTRKNPSLGTPGELGDVLRDEPVVPDRLALGHQLGLTLGTREALHQPDLATVRLELDGHLGRRARAPAHGLADVLAIRIGLPVEHQSQGLKDGRLAGLVGPADDGEPGCRLDLELGVALEVGQADAGQAHRQASVT